MVTGDKVWFEEEVKPYKIIACDRRFAVCTKPFNLKHTVLYTIIDLHKGIRGTHNMIFNCYELETKKGCLECIRDLRKGEIEVSYRNRVDLYISRIDAYA